MKTLYFHGSAAYCYNNDEVAISISSRNIHASVMLMTFVHPDRNRLLKLVDIVHIKYIRSNVITLIRAFN